MALVRALLHAGKEVECFKTGPDYIDTAFLSVASKRAAGNLDLHLMGRDGVHFAFSEKNRPGNVCIIEGAMGYFDGIGNTFENSSFEIAKTLGVKTILVYSPAGEMFSAVTKIKGMVDFSAGQIEAVILNRIKPHLYEMLKEPIEKYAGVKVIGYFPPFESFVLGSRHLGLIQSCEIENISEQTDTLARELIKTVDIAFFNQNTNDCMSSAVPILSEAEKRKYKTVRVAVAADSAFSFLYRENMKMLEECATVFTFSPLTDRNLPPCDLLYLPGGYPEVFAAKLSENTELQSAIFRYAEEGGAIYAECGGLMYLTEKIGNFPMAGILKASCEMTSSLQNFGYVEITLKKDCLLGKRGDKLTGHEFHKSVCLSNMEKVYSVKKSFGDKSWECGYAKGKILAAYPHIHFYGNKKAFFHMLDTASSGKGVV